MYQLIKLNRLITDKALMYVVEEKQISGDSFTLIAIAPILTEANKKLNKFELYGMHWFSYISEM